MSVGQHPADSNPKSPLNRGLLFFIYNTFQQIRKISQKKIKIFVDKFPKKYNNRQGNNFRG